VEQGDPVLGGWSRRIQDSAHVDHSGPLTALGSGCGKFGIIWRPVPAQGGFRGAEGNQLAIFDAVRT
jgi:hypothetical protein